MSGAYFDDGEQLYKPLSIADAMAITGKSKRTIDRWIQAGHLRRVRLGDELVLVEEDVLQYEKRMWDNLRASRTIGPDSAPPATT